MIATQLENEHAAKSNEVTRLRVSSTDGVMLSVYDYDAAGTSRPTVVLVHGYPDQATVWDGVVAWLRPRYRVVTYDTRGAGASDKPEAIASYRLPQLLADLRAVIDAVSPTRAVHLLGHDWGAIQGWHAVTDVELEPRIASYTAISGCQLDHAGAWLRSARDWRGGVEVIRQLARSAYIPLFALPWLPEQLWRSGVLDRILDAEALTGELSDRLYGLKLYRANVLQRLAAPQPRATRVPVQLLVPTQDAYVGAALQAQAAVAWTEQLTVRQVHGGHWMVRVRPDVIGQNVSELIDQVESGKTSPGLRAARKRASADRPLAGQLALITGAAAGIGRATALEFARHGADIVLCDIDQAKAEETRDQIRALGVEAAAYRVDVADVHALEQFAELVREKHGTPDIVVNNAGIGMAGRFLDTSTADWQRIIDINLWGVIHGSRLFAKQMVARGQGGRIVNIASAAAYSPSLSYPAYATTKAAVLMLTECMRAELEGQGIGVTAICPGFINSNIASATEHVGVDETEQHRRRQHAVKSYGRRNFSTERTARQIVAATLNNEPLRTITLEAKALLLMRRFAPALARKIAKVDLTAL